MTARCARCGCVYGQKGHDYCECPEFTPEHRIESFTDLLNVATAENVDTLTKDLALWLQLSVAAKGSVLRPVPVFVWRDDDAPGLTGIRFSVDDAP